MPGTMLRDAGGRRVPVLAAALLLGGAVGLAAGTASAGIISVQFENSQSFEVPAVNYSGVEPDAAKADAQFAGSNQWNHLGEVFGTPAAPSFSNLINSTGANSGASLGISHITGAYNNLGGALPDTYFYSFNKSQNFTISGLAPNESYTLFLYAFNSAEYNPSKSNDRDAVFTVGGASFDTANGKPSSEDPNYAVTGLLTGTTSATGSITGTWAFGAANTNGEIDWSGFQLALGAPTAVPEPGSLALFGGGLVLLGLMRRRTAKHHRRMD